MQVPQRLNIEHVIRHIPTQEFDKAQIRTTQKLAVAVELKGIFSRFLRTHTPYLIEDYRLGIIKQGEVHTIINLQEHCFKQGTLIFITPGTIVEHQKWSDDFCLQGMSCPPEWFATAHQNELPSLLNGTMRDGHTTTTDNELQTAQQLFLSFWNLMGHKSASNATRYNMVATISNFYNDVFSAHGALTPQHGKLQNVLSEFISLVNQNCHNERNIDFYASRMCMSERYLGTLVRQASGVTAKEWIDRAVITRQSKNSPQQPQHGANSRRTEFPQRKFLQQILPPPHWANSTRLQERNRQTHYVKKRSLTTKSIISPTKSSFFQQRLFLNVRF